MLSLSRERVGADLAPWNEQGISKDLLIETENILDTALRFKIINNCLYLSFSHHKFKEKKIYNVNKFNLRRLVDFVSVLHNLLSKYKVANTEFVMNLHDAAIVFKDKYKALLAPPMFGYSKTKKRLAILVPYDFSSWDKLSMDIDKYCCDIFWNNKKEKLFFQGTANDPGKPYDNQKNEISHKVWTKDNWMRHYRCITVLIGKKHPDLIDARLGRYCKHISPEVVSEINKHIPKKNFITDFKKIMQYKYLLIVSGNAFTTRTKKYFASNCCVFKQECPTEEFFDCMLKPYIHYIPVKRDLSDLTDQIYWAKSNDSKAKEIADNGRNFMKENITSKKVYKYLADLLKAYADILRFSPVTERADLKIPAKSSKWSLKRLVTKGLNY